MRKKIIRVILFPAILCLLLVPASLLVLPKNNTAEAGTLHPDADGILSQRRNSIDVLFLGDSLAYCGFMPLELWDTYGIPGFVCSSLAEKTFETQELLEQALRCQSPKVVVLDVNVLYWTCKKDAAAFYKLGAKVPVFRYHDRWKSLGGGDFFSLPHYTAESPNRGYLMKTGVEYSSPGDYMQAYPGRGRPGQGSLGYLRQIAQICAREQIPLVLCSVPSAANWNGSRHDAIAQIAEELGVPYLVPGVTNQIFPILPDKALEELAKEICFTEMERVDDSHRAIRFCTSWATTEENVKVLTDTLRRVCG